MVSIGRVKELLRELGADRFLLLGAPGIGKTVSILEYAKEKAEKEGLEFVDVSELDYKTLEQMLEQGVEGYYLFYHLYAPVLRVEDMSFVARVNGRYDTVLSMRLELFTKKNVRGLIFIDELTNVQLPDVLTMLFSLVLDKKISGRKLSDKVEVVAAGNRAEDSSVVNDLPAPLLDRFRAIVEVDPPNVNEWLEWMRSKGYEVDERISAYLLFSKNLISLSGAEGLEKGVTPRTWTTFNEMIRGKSNELVKEIAKFALGRYIGAQFIEFIESRVDYDRYEKEGASYWNTLNMRQKYMLTATVAKRMKEADDRKQVEMACYYADVVRDNTEFSMVLINMLKANGVNWKRLVFNCNKFKKIVMGMAKYLR